MIDVLFGFVFIIIGLLGIFIGKKPKNDGTIGYVAFIRLYYCYCLLVVFGIFVLISEFSS